MKYVVAVLAFALLVYPVKFTFGEAAVALLALGCLGVVHYWPKAQHPDERTPDSTS